METWTKLSGVYSAGFLLLEKKVFQELAANGGCEVRP
jgi:hypothetical protein